MKRNLKPWRKGCMMLAFVLLMTLVGSGALAAETETVTATLSPTTGLPTDMPYQPILVSVSNSESARPAWGLASADVVYEAVYWRPNHTRYLAVFNDEYPEMVGSLREACVFQADWQWEWDCPLVFRSGNDTLMRTIYDYFNENNARKAFLFDALNDTGNQAFRTSEERISPHYWVVNLREFIEDSWPVDEITGEPYAPRLPQLTFSDTPSAGDKTATQICFKYVEGVAGAFDEEAESDYQPSYTFNPEDRVYERWYNGEPHTDFLSGERVVASNVITQYCALSFNQDIEWRPILETTGSGRIDAFIDGQHIQGTWVREDLGSQTQYFDANGDPLVLLPGKTFIQVLSSQMSVKVVDDNGETYICSDI